MPFRLTTTRQDRLILPEDLKQDLMTLGSLLDTVVRSSAGTEHDSIFRYTPNQLTNFRGKLRSVLQGDCTKDTLISLSSCSRGLLVDDDKRTTVASDIPDDRILGLESLLLAKDSMLPIRYEELQKSFEASIELWHAIEPRMVPLEHGGAGLEDSIASDLYTSERSSQDSGATGASHDLLVVIPAASSLCGLSYVSPSAAQSGFSSSRRWKEPSHSTFLDDISAYSGFLDRVSLSHLFRHTASGKNRHIE
jgi:hypothetical protein